jgi:hypothetical protein
MASFYANDATIFVAPVKEDISNLSNILEGFGEVSGFCTIFQKSSVVPNSLCKCQLRKNLGLLKLRKILLFFGTSDFRPLN